ncbi:hypothetical protein Gogos_020301, partial [Gossypium gossypioides]|nr:hypothetical protein [Gossypium gossypioides]
MGDGKMSSISIKYLMELFTSQGMCNSDHILAGVKRCITDDMNRCLTVCYEREEIFTVVNVMALIKASRPDGYLALFFQTYWCIVGQDVRDFCLDVPMKSLYDVVQDSKAVVNRFKKVLNFCVDEAHSAFVPGRLIIDNILFAYEILDKDDVEDGFCERLGGLYSSMRNEGLSSLIRMTSQDGLVKGARICNSGPEVSHFSFVDDNILFRKTMIEGATSLKKILKEYEELSGQCVNYDKSIELTHPIPERVYGLRRGCSRREWVGRCEWARESRFGMMFAGMMFASDMVVWGEEPLGEYTVRSGYRVNLPEKIKITVWRIFNNLILNFHNLYNKRLVGSAVCPKCARGVENLEHDFRDCPFVAELDGIEKKLLVSKVGHERKLGMNGIIVRDSRCRVIGSTEIVNDHVSSTFATEALACLRTLRLGMNLGIREVVVEGYSLSVDIKSEERMYRDRQFTYVPRESNGTTHILAREGLKRGESMNLGVYVEFGCLCPKIFGGGAGSGLS